MADTPEKKPGGNKSGAGQRRKFTLLKSDDESYSFIDVVEQIVILVGFMSFLAGFWYVVVRLIISYINRGA